MSNNIDLKYSFLATRSSSIYGVHAATRVEITPCQTLRSGRSNVQRAP